MNDEIPPEETEVTTDEVTEDDVPPDDSEGKPLSSQPAYAFWVVVVAILVVGGTFAGALVKWGSARDVVTTMGVVTAAVTALVAAFFGLRAGTYAQSKDVEREKHRDRVQHVRRKSEGRDRPGSGTHRTKPKPRSPQR